MINKENFINESKLAKIIQSSCSHIVNIKDESFQYCNGLIIVNCTYDLDLVIQKLFKVGAISNYKNWLSNKTHDFKAMTECEKEVPADLTGYLKMNGNKLSYVFKIGNRFISYKKDFIDLFENVEFKAADGMELPNLRVYGDGNLIGIICPIRESHDLLAEIQVGQV